ncbi:hypothetical protein [Herbaspirillum sp. LeCh32-8]|uniref:hypothetical protein n=1 Tax=Herbaspirillum sp. LeCh32-8 TaxID=2821356 RepID=UPI001AEB3107|nr:hypothetical protein [Herbaspirillum sp. LeCh32-8]
MMMTPRQVAFFSVLALTVASASGQPFDQRGPTGDNRAATGNPGTQQPPEKDAKAAARQKTPRREEAPAKGAAKRATDSAPTPHSPGTPAENSSQPDSAK